MSVVHTTGGRVFLIATLSLVLLFGSVLTAAQSNTIVHLTYASHATEWSDYLQQMAKRFEEETGIRVQVEIGPGGAAYREQVLVRTAGGVPPDVMDFNPGQAAMLIQDNLFVDLRPYIKRYRVDLSQYPPVGIQGMTALDGTIWGIPMSIFPVPVYFNADMFAEAGLLNPNELGDDWTWETYLQSARRLTIRHGDGPATQSGTIDTRFRWEMLIHQAGGQAYDRHFFPTESRLNTQEVLTAFNFRHTLWQEGLIATSGGVWNGNVALTMIDGPTIINRWQDAFQLDAARQPLGPASRASVVNPDGFQIHADSQKKEQAWQWIHYLTTDVQRQVEFSVITGRLPSLREAMLRYNEMPRRLTPNWYALIETAFDPDAYVPYVVPNAAVTSALNSQFAQIWSGEVAPAIALQQAHEVVSALLREQ